MKIKSTNLVIASILLAVFLISFTSATLSSNSYSLTFDDDTPQSITITSNESTISYGSSFTINGIDFVISGNETIDSATNKTTLTITPQSDIDLEFLEESYNDSFVVSNSASEEIEIEVILEEQDFCEYSDIGYLNVDINDWSVNGYGDDDEWFIMDEIEIEVEIQNDGNEDLEDVQIEWGLYDNENKEWLIDVDDEDEFDLDEDDEETITFTFTLDDDLEIDLDDLEDGTLELYVRATGEVADGSDEGKNTCDSDSESFDLIIEEDFVILTDLEFPKSLPCNSDLQISADVWNIGDDDQDDVEVKIVIPDFDIEEYVSFNEIEAFDSESLDISIALPENAESGTHTIKFSVLDDDGDVYEADNDDELSQFSQSFTITGDCSTAKVAVSATLEDGVEAGKAGETLKVKATITNTGSATSDYVLNLQGYSEWADSASVSESSFSLDSGEQKEVVITVSVKEDVSGEKLFNIEVLSNEKLIATQPVSVPIEEKKGFLGITGFAINQDNWHIWGIGLLNLILVIVIIIVAVRIARRR